jgi:hypothetical protein|tara:strand:+ start:639 stop:812 length:174 start_codon:yes stop_codon:yes gene_type:complete
MNYRELIRNILFDNDVYLNSDIKIELSDGLIYNIDYTYTLDGYFVLKVDDKGEIIKR